MHLWTAERRIAGVSSFGAGGANAHVLVEEWPSPEFSPPAAEPTSPDGTSRSHAVILSARDAERLRASAAQLLAAVEKAIAPPYGKTADRDDTHVSSLLRAKLAEILDVAPEQIDDTETFETLGFDRVHRLALRDWLESKLGVSNAARLVHDSETPEQLLAALGARAQILSPDSGAAASLSLADIAFTLQVGREAMDARLALEARTLDELATGLRAFLEGRTDHPGLHTGNAQDHRSVIAALSGDDEMRALARSWAARGSLGRLLSLWVQGLPVDWEDLPRPTRARIVSLPTYPFARDRYWLPMTAGQARAPQARVAHSQPASEIYVSAFRRGGSRRSHRAAGPRHRGEPA